MSFKFSNLKKNIKNDHVISWFVLSLTVLYVFTSILIEFQDWHMVIYSLLSMPLFIGLYLILKEEVSKKASMSINYDDGLFVMIGVFLTYFITHQLKISPVISSSAIGLIGFLGFRKYSTAIYCGSFAGMVSSFMFDYLEVGLIALVCALLFVVFKPVFKGIGGKLGTTAFLTTMLISFLFNKDLLIIDHELTLIRLLVTSLLGTFITYYVQHFFKQTAVFSSAFTSLIFALLTIYIINDYLPCAIVFFSASFVGMSSKRRLPHVLDVLIASIIHAFLFFVYFEHYNGLGGKLGLMALTSVIITMGIRQIYLFLKNQYLRRNV